MSVGAGWISDKVLNSQDFGSCFRLLLQRRDCGVEVLWVFGGMAVPLQPNKSAINTITNVTTMRNRWAAQRW